MMCKDILNTLSQKFTNNTSCFYKEECRFTYVHVHIEHEGMYVLCAHRT